MSDVICPCCARPVAPGELQRDALPAAPSRAALESALAVIDAATRAGMLGGHAHGFLGAMRLDLAGVPA